MKRIKAWFTQAQTNDRVFKLERRIAKIPTRDLIVWAESTQNALGRSLLAYDRNGDASVLDVAAENTEALHVVVQEIRRRGSATV